MTIEECDPDLIKRDEPKEAEPFVSRGIEPHVVPEEPTVAEVATEKPAVEAYFNAESLFDFDKAVVNPEGRKILDEKIVNGMNMHPEVELLIITGHADRIGTEGYNQVLSERRANAVKAYLVKQGVAAERMRHQAKVNPNPIRKPTPSRPVKAREAISSLHACSRTAVSPLSRKGRRLPDRNIEPSSAMHTATG